MWTFVFNICYYCFYYIFMVAGEKTIHRLRKWSQQATKFHLNSVILRAIMTEYVKSIDGQNLQTSNLKGKDPR